MKTAVTRCGIDAAARKKHASISTYKYTIATRYYTLAFEQYYGGRCPVPPG